MSGRGRPNGAGTDNSRNPVAILLVFLTELLTEPRFLRERKVHEPGDVQMHERRLLDG
ncbi:hypothetical protein [Halorhabdus salina]|uniref:hypothetical protein n=1 Tax=Halorhabdus salina TaxID=2750670 RepID=UPI0015EEEEA6|nr:hypothetical protein [Halorhabdus salina]